MNPSVSTYLKKSHSSICINGNYGCDVTRILIFFHYSIYNNATFWQTLQEKLKIVANSFGAFAYSETFLRNVFFVETLY